MDNAYIEQCASNLRGINRRKIIPAGLKKRDWDNIEEVEPDEIDLRMMADIETNPDCNEFISEEELMARRKSRKN